MKMDCGSIIKKYLEETGFDGLFKESECACELDDLFPCGEDFADCEPGYRIPCNCERKHNYHIRTSKDPRDWNEEE